MRRCLRTSEQPFRTSVESFSDAFGIYSAVRDENDKIVDFRVDYVNDEACRAELYDPRTAGRS